MEIPEGCVLAVSGFTGFHAKGNGLYMLQGEYLRRPFYTHLSEDLHIYSFGARWALGSSVGPMRPLHSAPSPPSDIWAVGDTSNTRDMTAPSGVWSVRGGIDASIEPYVTSDIDLVKLQWECPDGSESLTAHHFLRGSNSYAVLDETQRDKLLKALYSSWHVFRSSHVSLPDGLDFAFSKCFQALGDDATIDQTINPSKTISTGTCLGGFPVLEGHMRFQPSQSLQTLDCIPLGHSSVVEKSNCLSQLFHQCKAVEQLGPLLQELHQLLLSEAMRLDGACMQQSVHYSPAGSVLGETLTGSCRIEVASVLEGGKVLPGDLICIENDLYMVEDLGSIAISPPLRHSVSDGSTFHRIDTAPLIVAPNSNDGASQVFFDNVIRFDPNVQPSADDICLQLIGEQLPSVTRAEDRKKALIRTYTRSDIYTKINQALYKNEVEHLRVYGGYIRELKEVFLGGQDNPVVVPYKGDVARGGYFKSDVIQGWRKTMDRGQQLCWASFTPTCAADDFSSSGASLPGNVKFNIRCFKLGDPQSAKSYPAKVSDYSLFKQKDDIIFPPHCAFRFVNISSEEEERNTGIAIVDLETLDFPSVWQVIQDEDWNSFQKWARGNPDKIDAAKQQHSIIGAVADSITKPVDDGIPDPISLCLDHGASPNEIDKRTGEIPIVKLAKKIVQPSSWDLTSICQLLLERGADPHLIMDGQPSASAILMENDVYIPGMVEIWCWQYWVDDGVDGKSDGWYNYTQNASDQCERAFRKWQRGTKSGSLDMIRGVSSGEYRYTVDLQSMWQRNEETNKSRDIRRIRTT